MDINCYVWNCDDCCKSTISQNKTPELLKPFLILKCLWQHIFIDFHELLTDQDGYNMVTILVDRFGKRPFLIPCHKNINAKKAARLYIHYVYQIYRPSNIIVFNYRPQFILTF